MGKGLIAILALCLMFTTFLTACTTTAGISSSVPNTGSSVVESSSVPNSSSSAIESSSTNSSTASKQDSSVAASANSSAALTEYAKKQNDVVGIANSDALTVQCTARGTSLVYTYTYGIDMDSATAQKSLDSLNSTYSSMLSLVKLTVKDCTSIIVEIKGKSGTVIATKEYK